MNFGGRANGASRSIFQSEIAGWVPKRVSLVTTDFSFFGRGSFLSNFSMAPSLLDKSRARGTLGTMPGVHPLRGSASLVCSARTATAEAVAGTR